jgi:hypothetical protein
MIFLFQITAVVFALIMIYFALLNYRRRELSNLEFYFWVIIWTAAIFIVMFPDLVKGFAKTFLFTRVFDMMVVAGFILVITMVSISYVRTKRMKKKLDEYVRKEALSSIKNKKSTMRLVKR